MILIVCVDDTMGMAFNGRRQSRDRFVCDRILNRASGSSLFMSQYSAGLFSEYSAEWIKACDDYLEKAADGDYCFAELDSPAPYEDRLEKIIIYRWNRRYPSDVAFDIPLKANGWRLDSSVDFEGYSHEKITEEIYSK